MGNFKFDLNGKETVFTPAVSGTGDRRYNTRYHIDFVNDGIKTSIDKFEIKYDDNDPVTIWESQTYTYINNVGNDTLTIYQDDEVIYSSKIYSYTLFNQKGHKQKFQLTANAYDYPILYPYNLYASNTTFSGDWHFYKNTMTTIESKEFNTNYDNTLNISVKRISRGVSTDFNQYDQPYTEYLDGNFYIDQYAEIWPASLFNESLVISAVWALDYDNKLPCLCGGSTDYGTTVGSWGVRTYKYGADYSGGEYGKAYWKVPKGYNLTVIYTIGGNYTRYLVFGFKNNEYVDITNLSPDEQKEFENKALAMIAAEKDKEVKDNTGSH